MNDNSNFNNAGFPQKWQGQIYPQQGVPQMPQAQVAPQTPQTQGVPQMPQAQTAPINQKPPKKRKPHTTAKVAALLAGVIAVGGGAGFGGAYFANRGATTAIVGSSDPSSSVGGGDTSSKVGTLTLDSLQNSVTAPQHNLTSNIEFKSDGSYMYTRDLVNAVRDSIVYITTYVDYKGKQTAYAAGSGILISSNGYLVTNAHVVDEGTSFTVKVNTTDPETGVSESVTYDAQLCGKDTDTDLAVMKIEGSSFPAAKLGDSDELRLGDDVIAIGNPLGFESSVTKGIISGLNRQVSDERRGLTSIQTDTPINSGNSGGALFNTFGEVVGVVNQKRVGTYVENISFAITINEAKSVINDLISNGYVTGRAMLGITYLRVTESAALYNGYTAGWQVTQINSDMAVADSGLLVGDTIIKIDGKSVFDDDIQNIFTEKKPGDYVTVTVVRTDSFGHDKNVNIKIRLSEYKGE